MRWCGGVPGRPALPLVGHQEVRAEPADREEHQRAESTDDQLPGALLFAGRRHRVGRPAPTGPAPDEGHGRTGLTDADLARADRGDTDPVGTGPAGADRGGADPAGADRGGADSAGTDLRHADLSHAGPGASGDHIRR